MASTEAQLLGPLLRDVSRTFFKTLKILPASIRKQISLAYLLARTTDTIADTDLVPRDRRLEALWKLRERILGRHREPLNFEELAGKQESSAEKILLEHCESSLALLDTLSFPDRELVRKVLDTITSGQELDLERFAEATAEQPVSLQTDDELDDYAFRVAGCVGEFWTRICRGHVFSGATLDDAWLIENGIRFGKGLQLINILRDLPADLKKGRCYLPATGLSAVGLQARDLLDARNEPRLRPLYDAWLSRAEGHLAAGWDYTNAIPWRFARVRLACALPILIGAETLRLLRMGPVLNSDRRIKVSRAEVKKAARNSLLFYPLPGLWKKLAGFSPNRP